MKKDKYAGLDNLIKKSSGKNRSGGLVTPNGIIADALRSVYGIDAGVSEAGEFMKTVITRLSDLATGGKEKNLFGSDMNDFFKLYVNTLNLCGRALEKLKENGIDLDMGGDDSLED